jgi:hypothetical protein
MVYFQTKNPNLGKVWRVLQWNELVYFMVIWSILHLFGIFYAWSISIVYGLFGVFFPFWYVASKNLATLAAPDAIALVEVLGAEVS